MAFQWNITGEDVAKSQLVEPGWHPTEITKLTIEDAKDKRSKNAHFEMRIFSGPHKGAENIFIYFNEKQPQFMAPLFSACGIPANPDGSYSVNMDEALFVGKKFMAYWDRSEYNGRPTNSITQYDRLPG